MIQPIIKYLGNNTWELCQSIVICGYKIPKGFKFDLATTPRFLWSILPPFGKYNAASTVHDYLYVNKMITREQADKIFLSQMKSDGVGLIRYPMYWYVRLLGWVKWNKII